MMLALFLGLDGDRIDLDALVDAQRRDGLELHALTVPPNLVRLQLPDGTPAPADTAVELLRLASIAQLALDAAAQTPTASIAAVVRAARARDRDLCARMGRLDPSPGVQDPGPPELEAV